MKKVEIFKEFRIEINQVPDAQFEYGGTGVAYQVFRNDELQFKLVVKTTFSSVDINRLYDWGLSKVCSLIDEAKYEHSKTYCFACSNMTTDISPEEVDCENFLWN